MSYKEIYIQISSTDEKKLLAFITQMCNCKILVPQVSNSDNAVFEEEKSNDSSVCIVVDKNIEVIDNSEVIEIPYGFSYISYERMEASDKNKLTIKLSTIYNWRDKKKSLVGIFDVIENWIKSNSHRIIRYGIHKTYMFG